MSTQGSDVKNNIKHFLKKLKVLYVEDDANIRGELSSILRNFIEIVYIAHDGEDGYNQYLNNKSNIDVIISDINMPKLSGIEMMQQIRKIDQTVPVIFATAYSDSEFLTEAIKIKVYDYIIKPINIRNLLSLLNELAEDSYQKYLLETQQADLQRYKDVIETNNIVLKIDITGKITYANKNFCEISGFNEDEIINSSIKDITHKDNINFIDEMLHNVLANNHWKGNIKNITKFNDEYIVETFALPNISNEQKLLGAILVQKDITAQINQKREIQSALMKAKSKVYLEGKETISELNAIINDQSKQINDISYLLQQSERDKAKLVQLYHKTQLEMKSIMSELTELRNQPKPTEFQATSLLKLNKENLELKNTIKKLEIEKAKLIKDLQKDIFREKVTLEVMVDDLEKELAECKEKIEIFSDKDAFEEILETYKNNAIIAEKKIKVLEAKVLRHCDKETAKIIFTDDRKESRNDEE